jgi:hypothetical protein
MMKYRPLIRLLIRRRRLTHLHMHHLRLQMGRRDNEGDDISREQLLITKKKMIISFDFRPCCDIGEQSLLL